MQMVCFITSILRGVSEFAHYFSCLFSKNLEIGSNVGANPLTRKMMEFEISFTFRIDLTFSSHGIILVDKTNTKNKMTNNSYQPILNCIST